MKQIRFLFFDLDGTLLDDKKQINKDCIAYLADLKKRKGLRLGFSTGRHEASVTRFFETYQLKGTFDGVICNSGADIYDLTTTRHIRNHYLSVDDLALIMNTFQKYDFLTVAFHNDHKLVATKMNYEVQTILDRNSYQAIYYPHQLHHMEAAPKCLLLFDPRDTEKVRKAVMDSPLKGMRGIFTEANICEILSENISKASGIAKYLEPYHLTLENVMVFGDAENDRQIMEAAGVSVCMQNGDTDIKALADHITPKTNNENGIMDFLMKYEVYL